MNFFEQELRRLVDFGVGIPSPTFAGRACYGDLGADNRVKLRFVTLGHHDHYEALRATILNRTDGEIDKLLFRFSDVWGKKPVNNPNFSEGVIPHLWTCDGKTEWYVYRPTDADIRKLADEVSGYLDVFADRSVSIGKERSQREGKASVAAKLRAGKKSPAPHEPVAKKDRSPEL